MLISPKIIIGFLIFILFLHISAIINYWYWIYIWFDIPMHFLGGFWVAMICIWLNSKFNIIETRPPNVYRNFWRSDLPKLILVLGFVALIGVFWEFFEFFYDVFISNRGYFGFLQLGAADTLSDLFFDFLGGLAFMVIILISRRRTSED
ncbi:hypothetical protein COS61_00640 [Candidatus Wolfebacteria bacterium CG03_land_8_20_14_0_80_40_12]|uniref:DUF2238 domain-containing protein n=1 Tax=Candidatus Wolfebacteria bacterium CG03_land_8_20_14_0_80_40_12 TaxID=1975069 RepID=A0A2M7B638_9BACT|nr:MAG: hypothetical protein COS61_00640 [Candidatus Wolfebacteria bacterium CG03_land_8_20_14_0_80_40_12]